MTQLTEGKKYWKARGKDGKARRIPLEEMDDDHLQRAYFVTQNKELEHTNISIEAARQAVIFADLREGLEVEAERRNLILKSIENEPNHKVKGYFENDRKGKEAIKSSKK